MFHSSPPLLSRRRRRPPATPANNQVRDLKEIMAKKVREKPKSGHKDKHRPSTTPKTVGNNISQSTSNGVTHVIDRGPCSHIDKGLDTHKLAAKIGNSASLRCEDCPGRIADTRSKKGHGKKRGKNSNSGSRAIWVCLECGHFGCGDLGVGLSATPQSHAVRHAKQSHHPLVVHYENHHLLWCFLCNQLVPEDSKHKEGLEEVSKMLKRKPGEGSNVDVEDVEIIVPGVSMVYSIRGLLNLGNTCFFNSIMQNLSAIDSLREYLFKLDESVGPLIGSLRNFFLEISSEDGLKNAIDPRSLFGSLCTKAPQFRGYQQHDSHELLRCLLDSLSIEELSAMKPSVEAPTFVDAIFGGQLSSTVRCLECGHSSTIYEPFLDLSLPVPMEKPVGRKIQHVARGKKPKVPPKKTGKNHSKMNRKSNITAQSTDVKSLGGLLATPQQREEMVLSSDSSNPNATDFDVSPFKKPENKQAYDIVGEQSASLYDFAWLDFLDPTSISDGNDIATETDDISSIHGFANEKTLQNDALISVTMDSKDESNIATAFSATSLDSTEDYNDRGLGSSFTFEDKQNENLQSSEVLFTERAVQNNSDIGHSTEDYNAPGLGSSFTFEDKQNENLQSSEVLFTERAVQNNSDIGHSSDSCSQEIFAKDSENPSQIQDSLEISSLDFVGLADLFSEPEVPSDQPLSEANSKNGVNGNIYVSDPNEVDDADAPVSVESCLSLFTKPELLLKDEHAWECDNCSKVLRERKNRPSKLPVPKPEAVNRNLDALDSSEIYESGKCMQLQNYSETETSASLSFNNQVIQSSKCESELTEQEDMDLEKLKVKRDATKTMLIRKVPSVLTIQLKRFSQDSRGRLSKLNAHVNFKETLDLKPYMDPSCVGKEMFRYRLVGLVEHLGSMRGGHYVAYVRGGSGKKYGDCVWYHASDAHVSRASLEKVMRSRAYILFYERT